MQCPCECPGLPDVYGEEFENLYKKYESEGKARRTIKVNFSTLTSLLLLLVFHPCFSFTRHKTCVHELFT
jgi:hypothetical protein